MSIVDTRQMPPAGWYQEPNHGVGLRYWDGTCWTEHVSVSGQQYTSPILNPGHIITGHISSEKIKKKQKKIYWSNLLRFRTWWFSVATGFVALFLLSLLGAGAILWTPVFVLTVAGTALFWMHQQMACAQCGTALRVTRLTGGQEVCHKCNYPTDKSLR